MYDFADSGKVSITTCKNNGLPTLIEDGWRLTDDSLFYLKEKKKNTYREHSYKLLEVTGSKMVLNYPSGDFKLIFYKVTSNKHLKLSLKEDFFINKTFKLEPAIDTLLTKVSFKENGYCTVYRKGKSMEQESHWIIATREDNTFLIIDDFEIFVVKKKNEKKSELELIPYGFLRSITGFDSVKLIKRED